MAGIGFILYILLMYIFLQYDAVIKNYPRIKWRIQEYKKEDEQLKIEVKKKFKQ